MSDFDLGAYRKHVGDLHAAGQIGELAYLSVDGARRAAEAEAVLAAQSATVAQLRGLLAQAERPQGADVALLVRALAAVTRVAQAAHPHPGNVPIRDCVPCEVLQHVPAPIVHQSRTVHHNQGDNP